MITSLLFMILVNSILVTCFIGMIRWNKVIEGQIRSNKVKLKHKRQKLELIKIKTIGSPKQKLFTKAKFLRALCPGPKWIFRAICCTIFYYLSWHHVNRNRRDCLLIKDFLKFITRRPSMYQFHTSSWEVSVKTTGWKSTGSGSLTAI